MRLAIFSDNFYPELSGISDSISRTAQELANRGHFITFYVPRHPKKSYKLLNLPFKEIELGKNISIVRFLSFPYPGTPSGQTRLVIPSGCRSRQVKRFNPDIIHSHFPGGVGLEALLVAKKLRKPLVGTNHTPMNEFAMRYLPFKTNWLKKAIMLYTAWYYNHCCFVSSPAQSVLNDLVRYGFKAPGRVVPNPLDLETFTPQPAKKKLLKEKFGFSGFTLLYAGRLAAEKYIDLTLRAIAKIQNKISPITFVIVGKGPLEAKLRNLAATLRLANCVKFMGFIETDKILAEIYNASEVFVIMSTAETQSIAAMQAMACGLPVIGANCWGLEEYLKKAGGLLVEPGDDKSLAESLLFLYKNPAIRKKIGEKGKKFVKGFSAAAIADIWEEIYERAIKEYN
jgi:glycosyltransferase involved in cell wall biosynthesis